VKREKGEKKEAQRRNGEKGRNERKERERKREVRVNCSYIRYIGERKRKRKRYI